MAVKTIIAGLGNIGMMYDYNSNALITHCKYIKKSDYFHLSGAVDKKQINRKRFKYKYKKLAFKNISVALKKINPQLVIIAFDEKKISNIKKILNYPSIKYMIAEKPFLYSLNEIKKFLKFLEKKRKIFMINFPRSFNSNYKKILNSMKEKKLGKIRSIEFSTSGDVVSNFSHFLYLFISKIPNSNFKTFSHENINKLNFKNFSIVTKKINSKYFFFNFKLYFDKAVVSIEGPPEKIKIYILKQSKKYAGVKSLKLEKKINLGILSNNLYKKLQFQTKKKLKLDTKKFIFYTKILSKLKN